MHSTHKQGKREKHYVCCCTENYVNNRESVNTQSQKQLRAALLLEEDYISFIRNEFLKTFSKTRMLSSRMRTVRWSDRLHGYFWVVKIWSAKFSPTFHWGGGGVFLGSETQSAKFWPTFHFLEGGGVFMGSQNSKLKVLANLHYLSVWKKSQLVRIHQVKMSH